MIRFDNVLFNADLHQKVIFNNFCSKAVIFKKTVYFSNKSNE